jgi:hypothetical protein
MMAVAKSFFSSRWRDEDFSMRIDIASAYFLAFTFLLCPYMCMIAIAHLKV